MKNRAPAFQFYASDYLADAEVQMLTLEQEGAYIRLLAYCWREGSLPVDPDSLAKLCKGCSTDVITVVERLFQRSPNDETRLVHKRLNEEREKQQVRRDQTSQAGKRSAEVRAKASKSPQKATSVATVVEHALNETSTLHSSSSSSSSTSQLSGGLAGNSHGEGMIQNPSINPSIRSKTTDGAGGLPAVPEIVHEIYRRFPIHVHDQKSLEAIQNALQEVSAQNLLEAVKAYAAEIERTKTQNPTWATKWCDQKMWKSYLPVDDSLAPLDDPPSIQDDQDLSTFGAEFYENLNRR